MASWRAMHRNVGALCFALTAASPSFSQSGSAVAQSGVVIFWDAAKCLGGYQSDNYSVHCEPGPSATILDFKTKIQFFCVNNEAVDIRWEVSTDPNRGSPIPQESPHFENGLISALFGPHVQRMGSPKAPHLSWRDLSLDDCETRTRTSGLVIRDSPHQNANLQLHFGPRKNEGMAERPSGQAR